MSRFPCLSAALLSALLWLTPLHASATTAAEARAAAIAIATADTCTSFGNLAESAVRARDRGVPLSTAMKIANKITAKYPDPDGAALRRWVVLFVYDMSSYTEASWIRNRVELKCFQTLGGE